MAKALVVLSGGQDSTTCLGWALQNYNQVCAITFDYNQRHNAEIAAARTVVDFFSRKTGRPIHHEIVNLGGEILAGSSFLTDKSAPVERFESADDMFLKNAAKDNKLDKSFVPMRNPLFLTIAANRAVVQDCDSIVSGVMSADFAEIGNLSWEWLGGFVDAEGCFTTVNNNAPRLSISQNDPELLNSIGEWIQDQFPETRYSVHTDESDQSELYLGVTTLRLIAQALTPHLHSQHRRTQAVRCGVGMFAEAELNDAYVTGFWEGDGSIDCRIVPNRMARQGKGNGTTVQGHIGMYQKDPQILEVIQDYLGAGTVYQRNTQNQIWCLVISDGPVSQKLLRRFRPHINCLHSLEKITTARHKVDLLAGGFNPPYPDCTPDFIWMQNKMITEALRDRNKPAPEILSPLMYLSKAASIKLAKALPYTYAALAYSHTAYDGAFPPTGNDHASVLRAHGFEQAGIPDPLILRAYSKGFLDQLPATANYGDHSAVIKQLADQWV